MMRRALHLLLVVAACGSKPATDPQGSDGGDGDGPTGMTDDASGNVDASVVDAPTDAKVIDAFPMVLNMKINCRNDCVLVAMPASISVSAGTKFEVNWINTGDTDCDVAKIDQFNHVPIIIGLEPGTSYHDSVREWCGQFTGTFQFRISICTIHSYIPVNCGA